MAAPQTRPADPPGTATRRAALRLLDAVLRRGQALEQALSAATRDLARDDDRAFAHAIAAEALRRLPDLDALIDGATRRPLPDDAKARSALRIALVQAMVLGTPLHAAISTTLPLVDGGPRKLVHGVFGTLMRANAALPPVPTLPAPVADRWRKAWGEEAVHAAARAIAAPPAIDLTLADDDALAPPGDHLAPRHVRVAEAAPVPQMPGFADGGWWVQDIAASIPARLIGRGTGRALDLCAAPGGKTLQLASQGWTVTALDVSESRLARLRDNLDRTGLAAAMVTADALDWEPPETFDAVLIDAPCSATGIFRRHPDVLHRVTGRLIAEAADLQGRLLARAAGWVRPGGALIYATCSLEPAEGEAQAQRFLTGHAGFETDPARPDELPAGIAPDAQGWIRTAPGTLEAQGGCDGFFVSRFRRRA